MVVCESVPTRVSQKARPSSVAKTRRDRYSRLTWWQMPMPGGTSAEAAEGALGPAQQLVALHVARVLDGDVAVVGRRVARALDDDRVVDDELDGHERVDLGGVAAEAGQRVAHGGQVDDAGDAGEVLHEDPLGGQGDLVGGVARALAVTLGVGAPGGHGHDVVGRDVRAVLVPEQVLEDHLDGVREAGDVVAVGERRGHDVEDLVGAAADGQVRPGAEGVGVCCGGGVGAHAPILPWARRRRRPLRRARRRSTGRRGDPGSTPHVGRQFVTTS